MLNVGFVDQVGCLFLSWLKVWAMKPAIVLLGNNLLVSWGQYTKHIRYKLDVKFCKVLEFSNLLLIATGNVDAV